MQRTLIGTETVAHGDEEFVINVASQSCPTKKRTGQAIRLLFEKII